MSTCKKLRGFMAVILALVMCIAMLPTAAFVAEADKTLTVGEDETYTAVQQAINAIYAEEDPTDWTIKIESGTYLQFAIPKELDGLTVKAADGNCCTISRLDWQKISIYLTLPMLGQKVLRLAD